MRFLETFLDWLFDMQREREKHKAKRKLHRPPSVDMPRIDTSRAAFRLPPDIDEPRGL